MKKTISTFLLALLGLTIGLAHAADPTSEVTESTDPARAQEVEMHAAQIREQRAARVAGAHKKAEVDRTMRRSTARQKRAGVVAGAHQEAEVDRTMRRSTARQKRAATIGGAHQEARDARLQQQQQQQQAQPVPAPAPAPTK